MVQMGSLGEFELIERYFTRAGQALPARVRAGIGDDCALIAPRAGCDLAVSTDLLVEGRHFLPTVSAAALGHKALAVNLSDLAACGAEPLAFTLTLALPRADAAWLDAFSRGLFALADAHRIALVGGDTTKSVQPDGVSPGPHCIGITVLGDVPQGAALLRSGARPGDECWVSGTLGDARLALGHWRGEWHLSDAALQAVRPRMEQPAPRIALGMALRGVASSAIDVSDGLLGDLRHVLQRSGVGATLHADALPRSAVLQAQPVPTQRLCTLAGGDDYELLFTAPQAQHGAVLAAAQASGTPVACVGRITQATGVQLMDANGATIPDDFASFDHFR
ncbi:MAG: thiamine-phosphate kinase [Betaproteobacteria bacterium]|nr:thiamine-phosphate kinase [Betaproteobacteria bacterium]